MLSSKLHPFSGSQALLDDTLGMQDFIELRLEQLSRGHQPKRAPFHPLK